MRPYPYTIENGAGEWLTFARRVPGPKGERGEGGALVAPGAGPPMHVHYLQDEAFTVVRGRIGYQIAGREPAYAGEGGTVVFRAGEAHRFWNAGDDDRQCAAHNEPAGNAEYLLEALFASQKANRGRRPSLLDVAYLCRRHRTEYSVLVIPGIVQRLLFPVLTTIGTALGRYGRYANAPRPLQR